MCLSILLQHPLPQGVSLHTLGTNALLEANNSAGCRIDAKCNAGSQILHLAENLILK
jgi:hypothetical protein